MVEMVITKGIMLLAAAFAPLPISKWQRSEKRAEECPSEYKMTKM